MQREHDEFKVGLTVIVVAVLFVAVLLFIGKWDTFFAGTRQLHVRFDHTYGVQGLRVNDPVRIGGVNVGRVSSIRHEKDKTTNELYIHVLADIPEYIDLYRDAKVTIRSKYIGEGGALEVLDVGGPGIKLTQTDVIDGVPLPGLPELIAKVSRELDESDPASLLAKIHKSMDDLNAISAGFRRQADPDQQASVMARFHQVMDNLNDLTAAMKGEFDRGNAGATLARVDAALDSLNDGLRTARTILQESKPKIENTVSHVAAAAKRVDEKISAPLAAELDRTNRQSLLAKIHASVSSAHSGLEQLRELASSGNELMVINRANLQTMVDNFVQTSSHLKATAKEVRRNPWRLLYKPDKPEREYANLMASARAFSDAAGALDQANSKLTQLLKLDSKRLTVDDPQLIEIREQINRAFCQFEQAQKKLWTLLKLKG